MGTSVNIQWVLQCPQSEGDVPLMKTCASTLRDYSGDRSRLIWNALILCLLVAQVIAAQEPLSGRTATQIANPAAAANGADGLIASPEAGWPQWRGPRRDGISDEKGLLSICPEGGPELLWKIGGLGTGWSSPVILDLIQA